MLTRRASEGAYTPSLALARRVERVKALLGTGRFASGEEILRAVVAALEQQNDDPTAIQNGIAGMEHGRYQLLAEFDAEFRKLNQIENGA